jgi:hypothetical protein
MARVRITKIPKALSGLEIKMQPGLYGTNGNKQFSVSNYIEGRKIAQQPTEVRDTLQPVDRKDANLEAEKGETAMVNIDGIPAHFKIGGKRHSKGGTPLNLPDNSFIFSDTAKMKIKDPIMLAQFGMVPKKSGYTPAEIAKKYDINKLRQVLADPNSEDVERKTAELMISNYNMKLAKLALLQESKKGFPQGIPVVAMPYVMATGMNPEELTETNTQGQEEESDEDMGVSRYGGDMVSQFPTRKYGGLPRAQTGFITKPSATTTGTMSGATSYNVPLQVNPKDIKYTEPSWADKALHGVNAVLEFPQRTMMYAGTGLFGDDYYEMFNPTTKKREMVHPENIKQWKNSGYKLTGKKTGFSDKAHYEMPGETLKRTYPNSSPAAQFAADVFVDPLFATSLWKTGGRLANRAVSKAATELTYRGELKGLEQEQKIRKLLEHAGKIQTPRTTKIATETLNKVEAAITKNPKIGYNKLDKISAVSSHNAAIKHDADKAAEIGIFLTKEARDVAIKIKDATASRAKKIYEGSKPYVKKAIDAAGKVAEVIDNPVAGPSIKYAGASTISTASKRSTDSQEKQKRKFEEEDAKLWKPAGVDPTGKIGLFNHPNKNNGKSLYYFDAGSMKPFTPQVQDSLNLLVKKQKPFIQTTNMTNADFLKSVTPPQTTEPDFDNMTVEQIDAWLAKNK